MTPEDPRSIRKWSLSLVVLMLGLLTVTSAVHAASVSKRDFLCRHLETRERWERGSSEVVRNIIGNEEALNFQNRHLASGEC